MSTLTTPLANRSALNHYPPLGAPGTHLDASSMATRISESVRVAQDKAAASPVAVRLTKIFDQRLPKRPLGSEPAPLRKSVPVVLIQAVVAYSVGLNREELLAKRRPSVVSGPRQVAMYLATQLSRDYSLPMIAREFRKKDHTTVMYARDKVKAEMQRNPTFKATVDGLREAIEGICEDLDDLCCGADAVVDRFTLHNAFYAA